MSRWDELEKASNACLKFTTGEWLLYVPEGYKGPDSIPSYGVEDINGNAIVWADLVGETGVAQDVYAVHITLANPKTVLTLLEQNRELLEALKGMIVAYDDGVQPEWALPYIHAAHAAIRKATGEEA